MEKDKYEIENRIKEHTPIQMQRRCTGFSAQISEQC